MNGKGGKNSAGWSSKQSWFKDVLSKSGTELLKICNNKNKKNKMQNNEEEKSNEKETDNNNKMVYYQSTPLIVKTEQQSSQVQFCTPTGASTTTTTTTNTPQTGSNLTPYYQNVKDTKTLNYCELNGVRAEIITPQQQQQQQQQQQSIINSQLHNLNNIKLEILPPAITLYAKNANVPTTTAATLFNNEPPVASKTLTTLTNVTSTTTVGATKTSTIGRRITNNNGLKPQFKCEQCGMTFGSKSAHTSHTKSHAKSNALMNGNKETPQHELNDIGSLPLGIPKTPQIKPFANGITAGDPYQCNVCQKTFAVPARLIRHYRTHTGERPFECEFCHKLFSVKENLQVHRRIHTKERPYKCDVCGRAFEHSGKLHRHMRIHTGERPHKCNVCEKTFIQSGQLVIHMRTHTGEKPYKCPVEGCGKGFTCSKQLKVHSRTHTGEKPYHCDICFRDFGYNHVLKLHRVQHYGSKCYKCTICDETFKSKKEMEAHIKGHANEMPTDEEETGNNTVNSSLATMPSSSASMCSASSLSSSGDFNSAPASPQSPTSSNVRVTKPRKQKALKTELRTPSPSSPSSTMSPPSSMASVSRMSAGSPLHLLETDQYSRDSGLASSAASVQNNRGNAANFDFLHYAQKPQQVNEMYMEELPTDLSKPHQQHPQTYYTQQEAQTTYASYEQPPIYTRLSPTQSSYYQPEHRQQQCISPDEYSVRQQPTINPALLEAASIASARALLLESHGEEVTQAALQMMQLKEPIHILAPPSTITVSALSPSQKSMLAASETAHYDDTTEANELIERYKRGDLAAHGIHKRTAPVPKFESSFLNNEIVRQVEAAIAPLRASTESPDRSSSPESDSMLLADRHCLTLPLRKRKLRPLSPSNVSGNSTPTKDGNNLVNEQKVMRLNSVIQFAKAS